MFGTAHPGQVGTPLPVRMEVPPDADTPRTVRHELGAGAFGKTPSPDGVQPAGREVPRQRSAWQVPIIGGYIN